MKCGLGAFYHSLIGWTWTHVWTFIQIHEQETLGVSEPSAASWPWPALLHAALRNACAHSGPHKERGGPCCGGVNSCVCVCVKGQAGHPLYKLMVFFFRAAQHVQSTLSLTHSWQWMLRRCSRSHSSPRPPLCSQAIRAASHSCLCFFSFSLLLLQMLVSTHGFIFSF